MVKMNLPNQKMELIQVLMMSKPMKITPKKLLKLKARHMLMVVHMKVNALMDCVMDMEYLLSRMAISIKEDGKKIKGTDKERHGNNMHKIQNIGVSVSMMVNG